MVTCILFEEMFASQLDYDQLSFLKSDKFTFPTIY